MSDSIYYLAPTTTPDPMTSWKERKEAEDLADFLDGRPADWRTESETKAQRLFRLCRDERTQLRQTNKSLSDPTVRGHMRDSCVEEVIDLAKKVYGIDLVG